MRRILPVDAAPLWDEPADCLVLRFNDLSEAKQRHLAERLKVTAPQSRLRHPDGPSVDRVLALLKEVNPVLYGESSTILRKRWLESRIKTLSSRYHRMLCQGLYRLLCRRRPLKRHELADLLVLGSYRYNHRQLERTLDLAQAAAPEANQFIPPPEEISLEVVAAARQRAENYH